MKYIVVVGMFWDLHQPRHASCPRFQLFHAFLGPNPALCDLSIASTTSRGCGDPCTGVHEWGQPPAVGPGKRSPHELGKALPILTAEIPCCLSAFTLSANDVEGRGAACRVVQEDAAPVPCQFSHPFGYSSTPMTL
jgi:hypothetical protein